MRNRPICPLMQINGPPERDSIMAKDAANMSRRDDRAASRETVMNRKQYRIALATLSVFIALASLAGIVHGMLFDERVFRYSIVTLMLSILSFVVLLNLAPGDRP